jgi:16S rRNA (cytidine1402-2'-O)-methyltransferase
MATLYLVSTPIGNLGDLSPRAGEVLGAVGHILAEDTRRTRPLLGRLGLTTPLTSFHAHNEARRQALVLEWLSGESDVALVSDAGTPLVSDPGERLVAAVLAAGHTVAPVPGPSAILAALVASGFRTQRFQFLGFLPRKGAERKDLLDRLAWAPDTTVLFESPERLVKLLEELERITGPGRRATVARELTKIHEEFQRGTVADLRAHFSGTPPRGEITLVLEGLVEEVIDPRVDRGAAEALAAALLEEEVTPSRAAKEVARRLRIPRNLAYEVVQGLRDRSGAGDPSDP